jgi:hypothetical protein
MNETLTRSHVMRSGMLQQLLRQWESSSCIAKGALLHAAAG